MIEVFKVPPAVVDMLLEFIFLLAYLSIILTEVVVCLLQPLVLYLCLVACMKFIEFVYDRFEHLRKKVREFCACYASSKAAAAA
jgi:hypothetical protein